jgi:phospholipid transport system substrate-binding protein
MKLLAFGVNFWPRVGRWIARPAAIFALAAFFTGVARAESPAVYIQRVQNELISAQRTGSMSSFAQVLRAHMDVPAVGLSALGPHVRKLAKEDRPAYYNGMINFIAKYAAQQSPKYMVRSAVVTGQGPGDAGGTNVDSTVTLRSGESYDVRWLVVKTGGAYKVRDVQLLNFALFVGWMTTQLDTLFQNYISENGGNPKRLVAALNQ